MATNCMRILTSAFAQTGGGLALALVLGLAGIVSAAAPASSFQTNGFRFVNLTPFATNSDALAGRHFASVPKGLQTFRGVPFQIGLPMGLNGMESARAGEHFPT